MAAPALTGRTGSLGLAVAVSASIAFAGAGPFVKPLLDAGWSAGGAVLVRLGLAALVLLPVVCFAVRRDPGVLVRHWAWITGYGALGVAGCQLAYFLAIERMPVGVALLIEYIAPVLLLLGTWARTRVRPAALSLVGAGLAIFGLALVIDVAGGGGLDPLGIAFAALAALMACAYFLIGANAPSDLPPVALIGGGLAVSTVTVGAVGAVGIVPIVVLPDVSVTLLDQQVGWWLPMSVVVLVGTVGGYLLGTIGAKLLGSRLASFVGLLDVVATVVMAAVLLGEIPTTMQLIGGGLILTGVVAVRLAPDHRAPTVEGGVPDLVGSATGVIPLPSLAEEEIAATGGLILTSRADGFAVVTGLVTLPALVDDLALTGDAMDARAAASHQAGSVETAGSDSTDDDAPQLYRQPVAPWTRESHAAALERDDEGRIRPGACDAGTAPDTLGESDPSPLVRVADVDFDADPHPIVALIPVIPVVGHASAGSHDHEPVKVPVSVDA